MDELTRFGEAFREAMRPVVRALRKLCAAIREVFNGLVSLLAGRGIVELEWI